MRPESEAAGRRDSAVTPEQMKEWRAQWSEYQKWAEANDGPDRRPWEAILKDLGFLYRSYSEEVRRTDPDPEKKGIQEMHRVFALHDRLLRSRGGTGTGE